jgi:hypothetical protein
VQKVANATLFGPPRTAEIVSDCVPSGCFESLLRAAFRVVSRLLVRFAVVCVFDCTKARRYSLDVRVLQVQCEAELKRFSCDGDLFWRGPESFAVFHQRKLGRIDGVPYIGSRTSRWDPVHRGTLEG